MTARMALTLLGLTLATIAASPAIAFAAGYFGPKHWSDDALVKRGENVIELNKRVVS